MSKINAWNKQLLGEQIHFSSQLQKAEFTTAGVMLESIVSCVMEARAQIKTGVLSKGCALNLKMLEEKEKSSWKVEHNSVLNSAVREGQHAKGIREEPMEIEKSYALIMLQ